MNIKSIEERESVIWGLGSGFCEQTASILLPAKILCPVISPVNIWDKCTYLIRNTQRAIRATEFVAHYSFLKTKPPRFPEVVLSTPSQ